MSAHGWRDDNTMLVTCDIGQEEIILRWDVQGKISEQLEAARWTDDILWGYDYCPAHKEEGARQAKARRVRAGMRVGD
jgi:hypothetical protein